MVGLTLVSAIAQSSARRWIVAPGLGGVDTIVRQGVLRSGVAYLQKPFTPAGLLQRVRGTLDRRPAAERAAV